MQVYFVRHGESVGNDNDRRRVERDPDSDRLTKRGWEQARELGKRLDGEGLTHIVASPMRRAQETARGINEVLKLPLDTLEDIFEIRQPDGFLELPIEERGPLVHFRWMADKPPDFAPPGGESFNDVMKRIKSLQTYLEKHVAEKNILVVSHGNFLRMFLAACIFREDFKPEHVPYTARIKTANTGISIFEYTDDFFDGINVKGWRPMTWMDKAHL